MTEFSGKRSSELNSLLTEFLNSERSDDSFNRLVSEVGGLVYGSALRRTGHPELAEEITQNVFCIVAAKAETLCDHPSLMPWLHRTTRFEAQKVLKKEHRYRRRIEKLGRETMVSSISPKVVSNDTLRLLEQAIDQLSALDRQLLLTRHYEGKKFREIAQQVNRTEEACRMRLRRVLDKMAAWLSRRGCTLSVAALTALLSKELVKACPATFVMSTTLSKLPVYTSSNFISGFVITMSSYKSPIILAALFVCAVGIPFVFNVSSKNSTSDDKDPMHVETRSERSQTPREERMRRAVDLLTSYPLAHDRLEEIYQKYPNLRPKEFIEPSEQTLIEEIKLRFKMNEEMSERLKVPSSLKNQILGKEPWNDEEVEDFLASRQDLIATLLEVSKFSTTHPKFFYRFSDSTAEISHLRTAHMVLNLALSQAIRNGEISLSTQILEAQQNFTRSLNGGTIIHGLVAFAQSKGLKKTLNSLGQAGYLVPETPPFVFSQQLADGFRSELVGIISLMEAVHTFPDRELLLSGLLGFSHDLETNEEKQLMDLFLEADFREVGDQYAAMMSHTVTLFSQEEIGESHKHGAHSVEEAELGSEWFAPPYGPILKMIYPSVAERRVSVIQEHHRLNLETQTLNAMNQARADDFDFTTLDDLVPRYLPEIPIEPRSRESFTYNPQTGSLEVPDTTEK